MLIEATLETIKYYFVHEAKKSSKNECYIWKIASKIFNSLKSLFCCAARPKKRKHSKISTESRSWVTISKNPNLWRSLSITSFKSFLFKISNNNTADFCKTDGEKLCLDMLITSKAVLSWSKKKEALENFVNNGVDVSQGIVQAAILQNLPTEQVQEIFKYVNPTTLENTPLLNLAFLKLGQIKDSSSQKNMLDTIEFLIQNDHVFDFKKTPSKESWLGQIRSFITSENTDNDVAKDIKQALIVLKGKNYERLEIILVKYFESLKEDVGKAYDIANIPSILPFKKSKKTDEKCKILTSKLLELYLLKFTPTACLVKFSNSLAWEFLATYPIFWPKVAHRYKATYHRCVDGIRSTNVPSPSEASGILLHQLLQDALMHPDLVSLADAFINAGVTGESLSLSGKTLMERIDKMLKDANLPARLRPQLKALQGSLQQV